MVKRSAWNQLQRDLYFTQRTMGDISAASRGTLGRRLIRRKATRSIWGPLLRALIR
jgi:hypothetical protein